MTNTQRVPGPDYLVAGRYRLRTRIGDGGMGSVWLAQDQRLGRDVACKRVVSLDGLPDENADIIRDRAMHEGRIASKLHHNNAVAVHDVAVDGGTPWLVMEYVPSRSVAQILHVVGTLSPAEAGQIGAQIAAAMAEAHRHGVVHRDIKPGNILVASTGPDAGQVKLTNFGIAHHIDDETLGPDDIVTGTPAYFAPEVARGALPNEASDVYSLGSTIYAMVEGVPPFGVGEDTTFLLDKVARAQFPAPAKAGPLERVLLAMLTPSPTKRPTMAQARDELAAIAAAATRTTPARILSGRVQRADGAVPMWALTTPQAPRLSTGSYQRSSVSVPRATPIRVAPTPDTRTPSGPRGWEQYRTLIVSAAIIVALIALLIVVTTI